RAASKIRSDPHTLIIARTDARSVEGVDSAIKRAKAYAEAGADVLFVEALESRAEMEYISNELKGYTLMVNMVENGKTPLHTVDELDKLGFRIIIWPDTTMISGIKAMEQALLNLKAQGISNPSELFLTWNELTNLMGVPEYMELSERISKE